MMKKMQLLLPIVLASWACNQIEQTPYKEIDRLRVLGMKFEDPVLTFRQATTITALVAPETIGDAVTYEWSWCPITTGAPGGYTCAIEQDELQELIDTQTGTGTFTLPEYSLGTSTSATYRNLFPRKELGEFCTALLGMDVPNVPGLPTCDGTFPITIELRVTSGVEGSDTFQSVNAVREIFLQIKDGVLNNNPILPPRLFATELADDGTRGDEVEVATDGSTMLKRDTTYVLRNGIGAEQSESYDAVPPEGEVPESTRETLTITWFIDGGDSLYTRTGFQPDVTTLDTLQENEWTPPKAVDYPLSTARLFLVLRDNRGGVDFLSRVVNLVAP